MIRGGAAPPPGWLSRNKWFLPVVALALMGLCIVGMVAGLLDIFGTLRSWPVYERALEAARADPRVTDALGEPVTVGWIFSGEIEADTGSMVFNVSGPKGGATVAVTGVRNDATWEPLSVEVYPHDDTPAPIMVIEPPEVETDAAPAETP